MGDGNNIGRTEANGAQIRKSGAIGPDQASNGTGKTKRVTEQRGASYPGFGAQQTNKYFLGKILASNETKKTPAVSAEKSQSMQQAGNILDMMFGNSREALQAFENESNRAKVVFPEKILISASNAPHQVTPGSKVLPLDHPMTLKNLEEAIKKASYGDGDVAGLIRRNSKAA